MDFIYHKELEAIQEAMRQHGEHTNFGPARKEDLTYLREIGVPDGILQFYERAEPADGIEISGARLWPVCELRIENEQAVPGYIIFPLGYRVIGSTIYGDAYCIDLNCIDSNGQPAVFLASNDEIYEYSNEREIRSKIIKIADSFTEFLRKFVAKQLPIDYYDIKESGAE